MVAFVCAIIDHRMCKSGRVCQWRLGMLPICFVFPSLNVSQTEDFIHSQRHLFLAIQRLQAAQPF